MNIRCSFELSFGKSPAKQTSALTRCFGFVGRAALAFCAVAVLASDKAGAQDKGTLNPEPLPPLAKPA